MNVDIPVLPAQSTRLNCTPQGAPRKTSQLEKSHVQLLGFFRLQLLKKKKIQKNPPNQKLKQLPSSYHVLITTFYL